MPKHRSHSIEFKRQVAQEFIPGERCIAREAPRPFTQPHPHLGRKYDEGAFEMTRRPPI